MFGPVCHIVSVATLHYSVKVAIGNAEVVGMAGVCLSASASF